MKRKVIVQVEQEVTINLPAAFGTETGVQLAYERNGEIVCNCLRQYYNGEWSFIELMGEHNIEYDKPIPLTTYLTMLEAYSDHIRDEVIKTMQMIPTKPIEEPWTEEELKYIANC